MAKIFRKFQGSVSKINGVVVVQKLIFRHYCIQNVKDGIQIRVYKISKERVTHCS